MLSTDHVIDFTDLTRDDVDQIMSVSRSFAEVNRRQIKKLPTLRGRTVVNLFLEPSTRTRTSFEIAAKRMSADAINFTASSSATQKGESLVDTAETLSAMGCDLVVVRHRFAGAPRILASHMHTCVVNGGDGMHQHPTQALLDLYTLRERLGDDLTGLRVGIVGDVAHSRVAGSLVPALRMMGAVPVLIGPPTLLPSRSDMVGAAHDAVAPDPSRWGAENSWSLDEQIGDLDVVYLLRVQHERTANAPFPDAREYARLFGLDAARRASMKPDAIVMHPGPMNRGVEISSEVVADPRTVVLDQVNSGVAVRMAVMYLLLGGEGGGAAS